MATDKTKIQSQPTAQAGAAFRYPPEAGEASC
jgi:hypothetical protein